MCASLLLMRSGARGYPIALGQDLVFIVVCLFFWQRDRHCRGAKRTSAGLACTNRFGLVLSFSGSNALRANPL